jgi:hypothetical protein
MGNTNDWDKSHFARRAYYIEDPAFAKKTVELVVRVEGQQVARLQLREPGLIAVVSKPDEEGFWLETVSPDGVRYLDVVPDDPQAEQAVRDWQTEAIGLKR